MLKIVFYRSNTQLLTVGFVMVCLIFLCLFVTPVISQQKKRATQAAESEAVSVEEAAKLEAVVTTDLGTFRFEFYADKAPKHVQQFIKLARQGFYDGSAFHRMVERSFIQGGDPLLKNPATPREKWGSGGFDMLPEEISDIKHVRGTVSAMRIPNKPNSDGAQFFVTLYPIAQYDGQYSAFGMVNEGIDVVEKISLAQADANKNA